MKAIKYRRWIIAALLISTIDVLADQLAVEGAPPEGMSSIRQFIGFIALGAFLLTMPISFFSVSVLTVIGDCININIVDAAARSGVSMWVLTFFLSDLLVCYFYFLLFQTFRRFWRPKRSFIGSF
jgi:uncharacterized BrkB/YihY/UPF0761 family membrane protein